MKKPELLAPAGSFEKAKVAFMYGADAVYCGTASLSLRSRAEVNDEDLIKTIKYAHSIGKKVYATLNIYACDSNYEEIQNQVKMLDEAKVDAIIASDGGVIQTIKKVAPNIEIHISTQANVVSYHSAKFWYDNGAKRVILGRETSKEQIKEIMNNKPKDLEVEMFVHGALCWAYSGRCFLSEYLSCRNANLGDCSQSCRWAYNMYLEEKNNPGNLMPVETDENGTYILSSKDLCLIKEIPQIVEMEVDSLKIEGRLKTEYYLASVVNTYRKAIDDYIENPQNYDYMKYMKELEKVKTRGLTTFYFNDRNNKDFQEYEGKQYNQNYEFGGKILENTEINDSKISKEMTLEDKDLNKNNLQCFLRNKSTLVEIKNKLSIGDTLELIVPNEINIKTFKIEELYDSETGEKIQTINPGKLGQTVRISIPFYVEKGWILRRKK